MKETVTVRELSIRAAFSSEINITGFFGSSKILEEPSVIDTATEPSPFFSTFTLAEELTPLPADIVYVAAAIFPSAFCVAEVAVVFTTESVFATAFPVSRAADAAVPESADVP